ncbi:MAG: methylmalonyl Co-A mutase-associated GTPase MeaB [Planctomycetes bacterium]|nr:methylmalonyl Co-A mutase-associated GTPase MeaB [Planctomycetota bacterium]
MELLDNAKSGDTRAIARALTLVEIGDPATLAALDALFAGLPQPQRIGITGPPGAGKSTLTSALISAYRAQGAKVGVVAIDPTSPFSGGALLGDRLRMTAHTLDAGVFVRSMATRGQFGGLAATTEDACDVLALAGFDPLIVETVGVGQSEVDIAKLADTTVVVLTPSAGDSVQALKAGIMEVADVVVINKSDQAGAERLEEDIKEALELRPMPPAGQAMWLPLIVRTVASEGKGIRECFDAIACHRAHLQQHALLETLHARRQGERFDELVLQYLRQSLQVDGVPKRSAQTLKQQVAAGELSPRQAARRLLASLNLG